MSTTIRSHLSESSGRTISAPVRDLLRQREGRLTRELLLTPGDFGLGQMPDRIKPDAVTQMVCGYCATGCSLNIHLQDREAVGLTPAETYPVNRGAACPKGWEALSVLNATDRATVPLLRNSRGRLEPVGWETALETFTRRFKGIQQAHGTEAVAFLSTGQIPTEEMALLGALTKFGMGMLHGDGNTRQCMATAVVAYKQAFGFDAPPYTYRDFEESDVLVFVGSNLCIAHPILWERVMRNPHQPDIIVIDPRKTETAMQATQHLPLRPKSDLPLFYGLARILIENDWIDHEFVEAHTNGFDEFAKHVAAFTPKRVSEKTGVDEQTLKDVAQKIHRGQRVSFWWTMGVNQSYEGVRVAQSLINLALMTGNIGRPGTGANSITGQCNAMGSRLFSNTTCLFGGRDFTNANDRQTVAQILNLDVGRIPETNSWAYDQIIEGILRDRIKGLWVIATNPVHSWINRNELAEVLDRLDFLVVQDMYHSTETARQADLVLPAAGWGEKEGTFINSERRIGRIKKVARAPGKALADFSIFKLIARSWGCEEMFADWSSPDAVFQILKRLSAGQPCDFTGIDDYPDIDKQGGIQWPFPAENLFSENTLTETTLTENTFAADPFTNSSPGSSPETERRLFTDGRFFHPDGKAKFLFETPRRMPEPPNEQYPLILLTGRGSVAQWHTQTRTSKSAILRQLAPADLYIEIHPDEARRFGIGANEQITVESQRGRLTAVAVLTRTVQPGQVFIPMHYNDVNRLTDSIFDPHSRQPSYKACAVRIKKSW